jgi:hypothetical protein
MADISAFPAEYVIAVAPSVTPQKTTKVAAHRFGLGRPAGRGEIKLLQYRPDQMARYCDAGGASIAKYQFPL